MSYSPKDPETEELYLVVGLGNPGAEYAHTRHNAGFEVVDRLANDLGVSYWKTQCGALTGKTSYHDKKLLLAKPQSFMNLSGGPVKSLMKTYGVKGDHVIIVHDDLDLAPTSVRVKFGGGHGGHNGLRSIVDKTGTKDWYRVRVGLGRPPGAMDVVDFVLSTPKGDAADLFAQGLDRGTEAVLHLLDQGLEKTQQVFR